MHILVRLISSRLLDKMRLDLSLPGPRGGRTYGWRQATSLDGLSVHRKVLCEQLWVQYIAQWHLGSPLKVFWHHPLLPEHLSCFVCTGPQTKQHTVCTFVLFLDFVRSYLALWFWLRSWTSQQKSKTISVKIHWWKWGDTVTDWALLEQSIKWKWLCLLIGAVKVRNCQTS